MSGGALNRLCQRVYLVRFKLEPKYRSAPGRRLTLSVAATTSSAPETESSGNTRAHFATHTRLRHSSRRGNIFRASAKPARAHQRSHLEALALC